MPRLFVLSAPSGAGKTTLCRHLLSKFPDSLALSISTTTRAPRPGESHGKDYFFVSNEEFETGIKNGLFAEWARVHDYFYGTSKATLADFLGHGKNVLLDIDVQGADSLKALYGEECVTLFVAPPSLEELEKRLRGRKTDSETVIQKRLLNAKAEMARMPEFDHVVINDSLPRALEELTNIVKLKGQIK